MNPKHLAQMTLALNAWNDAKARAYELGLGDLARRYAPRGLDNASQVNKRTAELRTAISAALADQGRPPNADDTALGVRAPDAPG